MNEESPSLPAREMRSTDPLHGITLEKMLNDLVSQIGWEGLSREINIRCFTHDPSVASSLKFLRRTPWAREKLESFYRYQLRQKKKAAT